MGRGLRQAYENAARAVRAVQGQVSTPGYLPPYVPTSLGTQPPSLPPLVPTLGGWVPRGWVFVGQAGGLCRRAVQGGVLYGDTHAFCAGGWRVCPEKTHRNWEWAVGAAARVESRGSAQGCHW